MTDDTVNVLLMLCDSMDRLSEQFELYRKERTIVDRENTSKLIETLSNGGIRNV